jgi:hypothetical protein
MLSLMKTAKIALALIILVSGVQSANAQIIFDNGAENVVDSSQTDYIIVRDSGMGAPTTVLVLDGADIPSFDPDEQDTSIMVEGSSVVDMSGGVTVGGFNLVDDAIGIFTNGIVGDEVQLFGNSIMTIGSPDAVATVLDIQDDLELAGNSIVDMYDGRVFDDVETTGSSVLNIFGGEFDEDIEAFDTTVINIFGGTFNTGFGDLDDIEGGEIAVEDFEISDGVEVPNAARINIHGGFFMGSLFDPDFCAESDGVITIFGSEFAVDGVPVPFGDIAVATGLLTGTLEDGSKLLNDFEIADNARIVLAEVVDELIGDVNCDGEVSLLDVAPFVALITEGGFFNKADINQDGAVDLRLMPRIYTCLLTKSVETISVPAEFLLFEVQCEEYLQSVNSLSHGACVQNWPFD